MSIENEGECVFDAERINRQIEKLEYARQEAKDFFIWYGVKILSLLDYIKTVKTEMGITSQEMEEKIKEFEGKPIDELYNQFQESKNKQP